MRYAATVVFLALVGAGLLWLQAPPRLDEKESTAIEAPRLLPGIQADGRIQLPNQWSLRPAGEQVGLGDLPINMAIHPAGRYVAILHQGFGDHEVIVMDLESRKKVSRHILEQTFYGLAFSPDGATLYASGGEREVVHQLDFRDGILSNPRQLRVAPEKEKFIPGGLAVDKDHKTLFVCGTFGQAVAVVPLDKPEKVVRVETGKDSHPLAALLARDGKRVFLSLWGAAQVAVLDIATQKITGTWATEKHPTELVQSSDGKTLYVACSNSTRVSVLDATTGKVLQTLDAALHVGSPSGNTPNSLTLLPDDKLLFVANADANNVAVFNVEKIDEARPMGFIPVGWYPTSIRYDALGKKLLVANGKGILPHANRHGPNPLHRARIGEEYIGGLFMGQLSIIPLPTAARLAAYTKEAFACSPLRSDFAPTGTRKANNPIPAKVGDPSPIKYCIYVIKENRTYDQVFGDIKEGNGDPNLCIFGEQVTPNHHKLVKEFVLLDNLYVEGEVSADGHQWTMAAYASDYVEKVWPLPYRGQLAGKFGYPSEGNNPVLETPAGGYLWDRAAEAKVSYRSYGEWVENGKTLADPGIPRAEALKGHIDEKYRSYDLDYPDVKRTERFLSELKRFEQEGEMPRLQIVRLPNDHTYGTRIGKPTPTAMVAENDLALGQFVEGISKSKFWKETAIFVIEDDAQNGPDHVDAHRTVSLVISPWTKRKFVDSSMYSTASLLRTMELILGLKPMSQFDAAARPMYNSFTDKPDFAPYVHVPANVKLDEKNLLGAWGAEMSEKFNLAQEDRAPDGPFNEVIWRSVRGANSPMPAPVRAAFFVPKLD
jgi:DNA-binding beta-propeller fold protein YncE